VKQLELSKRPGRTDQIAQEWLRFREFHPIASVPLMQQAATPEAGMRNVVAVLQPDEYAQSGKCIR
jgi:hypothetical protein